MSTAEIPSVAIVSGLPRSGTSVMMQMINAGGLPALTDTVRTADVDNPRGYFEFEPVKQTKRDSSWLDQAGGKVVKMVHLLLLDLPIDRDVQYRVVMMARDPDEVITSQSKMLQRLGSKTPPPESAQLKAIYAQQMAKVTRHLQSHPTRFHLLTVSYNDLIARPADEARRVNVFLGGTLDETAMAAAVEPSLYRNRKP